MLLEFQFLPGIQNLLAEFTTSWGRLASTHGVDLGSR